MIISILTGGVFFRNYIISNKSKAKIEEQNRLINEHSLKMEAQFNHNELLLKELHHRVKNNLQVMYSLLNLQKRRNSDEDTIETLSSIQNRIQTMALVHQNLYSSGIFEMVEISTYIKTLVSHLEVIYKVEKRKTELEFLIEANLNLPIEKVLAIGLIVNEAVSNSFKYAFKNKDVGKITIQIKNIDDETEICIQDNGIGINTNQKAKKENSLGLKLINLMCIQLNGTHSMENLNGVTHKIKFK